MCLVFFSYKYPTGFDFFICANRDEFYSRKTIASHFWEDDPTVFAGKDLEAGGTWMGVQGNSRFAFITNYRNLYLPKTENPISRGHLVKNFLLSRDSAIEYGNRVYETRNQYEGFNLVIGDSENCVYINNKQNICKNLDAGSYGLSNGVLDEPWGKVNFLKESMSRILVESFDNDTVFKILKNKTQYDELILPDTGIGVVKEKLLSSCFIEIPNYGTRSSMLIFKKKHEKLQFDEKIWVS
jgi:uncharacterized protein with NRDE domain